MDVAGLLEKRSTKDPDKQALIFRNDCISFKQLKEICFRISNALIDSGVVKGDRVAIYLPNQPEYIYSYLAVWCCGATAVPLDFMLTQDELNSCLSHSDAKVLISRPKANIRLEEIKEKCPALEQIILCGDDSKAGVSLYDFLKGKADNRPPVKIDDKDYAIIFYTSGTTGRPKGVLVNYRQLGAPPKSMGAFVDLNEDNQDDVTICALPFSHLGGLIYIQNNIAFGLTVVLMERFIPLEFLKKIANYKITCFWVVPAMYYALLQLKEFEKFDLSSLRWIVTFGASNSPDALRRFHRFCPNANILNGWGLTETNAPTTVTPMGSGKIESVGRPAPWIEVKVFNQDDKEMPAGEVGEVVVRSWVVSDGYYKDPQLTHQTIRNGWLHTGDLGKFDSEGDLYIVGRKKEMIKVAGEIVFEPEVEAAIHKHELISEVAVVGVKDKLRGEVPKAIVVLQKDAKLSEDQLRQFCREHMAHFKIPHYFEFRDSLPKNRSGKIDKQSLRKENL